MGSITSAFTLLLGLNLLHQRSECDACKEALQQDLLSADYARLSHSAFDGDVADTSFVFG